MLAQCQGLFEVTPVHANTASRRPHEAGVTVDPTVQRRPRRFYKPRPHIMRGLGFKPRSSDSRVLDCHQRTGPLCRCGLLWGMRTPATARTESELQRGARPLTRRLRFRTRRETPLLFQPRAKRGRAAISAAFYIFFKENYAIRQASTFPNAIPMAPSVTHASRAERAALDLLTPSTLLSFFSVGLLIPKASVD